MAKLIRVGLLGFGTVGQGVFELLHQNATEIELKRGIRFEIGRIGVRNLNKPRTIPASLLTTNFHDICSDPKIDLIVEAAGGVDPVLEHLKSALQLGKPVATANKELMAKHGAELLQLARNSGVGLRFESCVCAGVPIIAALDRQLAGNTITRIDGILNGTTNFILSKMTESGAAFEDVLAEAQALGYAEADPSADVDGYDAAYKLCILASVATGLAIDWREISTTGIRDVAKEDIQLAAKNGEVIKLIASMERITGGDLRLSVKPTSVSRNSVLGQTHGARNAILISSNMAGEISLVGSGAGGTQTASGLIGDAIELIHAQYRHEFGGTHTWRVPS